eukprot:TRINITY_DN6182_c2_g1_i2.p2 TRINITY_DN6182_c2_g1~~TRINITY_DN6182_c2_g1_i2.p2  ORF type:complete len:156 (-),score=23.62 TRINITY_DN6182_c2_g1_i2:1074-1541(-)
MEGIPVSGDEQVQQFELEYQQAIQQGTNESNIQDCKSRLVWSYVHSLRRKDRQKGLEMAQAEVSKLEAEKQQDTNAYKEMLYYQGVAQYQLGQYSAARRTLQKYMAHFADSSQGQVLKNLIDEAVVKEGLVVVGVAGGVVAAAGAIALSLLGSRR